MCVRCGLAPPPPPGRVATADMRRCAQRAPLPRPRALAARALAGTERRRAAARRGSRVPLLHLHTAITH